MGYFAPSYFPRDYFAGLESPRPMTLSDQLTAATADLLSKVATYNQSQTTLVSTQSAFAKGQSDAAQATKDLQTSHDSYVAIVDAVLKPAPSQA